MENNEINILLVEDNPGDARIVTEMLKDSGLSFKLTNATLLEEALKFLNNERFDIALPDLELPDSHGLSGLEKILSLGPVMPVILLTGMDDENLGMQAVQKNASDYLVKGQIKIQNLIRSIRYSIERKRGQMEREITIELLRLVNASSGIQDLIRTATVFFQKQSGCQAVGIRLREGNDYPYFETSGFPDDFIKLENSLCRRKSSGELERDDNGNPMIECMCGNVICGRIDPSKPFFTAHGSFWTNCTTMMIADSTETDSRARTIGNCNREGYESVALIPLFKGKEREGLLQLNDMRKGVFSPEIIGLWERLADHLAVALAKFRSEQALRENEERYRTLFNGMTEGFALHEVICDEKGKPCDFRFLDINPAFERLTGLKRESVLYRTHNEVMPGNEEYWIETLGKVALTGEPISLEHYSSALKKYIRMFAYRPAPRQFAVIFMDITERKRAEDALQKSEAKYRLLFDNSGDAIIIHNTQGQVLATNPMACKQLGYTNEELMSMTVDQIDAPDEVKHVPERIAGLLKYGQISFETVHQHKDGSRIPIDVKSRLIIWDDQPASISICRDITDRKKAEEILRRDKRTLQKLVKERSEELIEIQMELDRSKRLSDIGTLAATVAHELRNPLAGINLATTVIKRKTADHIIEQQLQRIDTMVTESSQIIDNLLFYSRLKPPQRKVLNAYSLLEECIDNLKRVRIGKNMVITKHIDSLKNLSINADPVQIREVFINILNNAADAIPDHEGKIEVKSRFYHDLITIHINDNGHGMAKEVLKKVFEPFFTTKAKGTGLGLTVCGQILKMHGGFINIKSLTGKGTSVIITLPKEELLKK